MTFDPSHSVAGVLAKDPSPSQPFKGTAFLIQGGVMVTCSLVRKEGNFLSYDSLQEVAGLKHIEYLSDTVLDEYAEEAE